MLVPSGFNILISTLLAFSAVPSILKFPKIDWPLVGDVNATFGVAGGLVVGAVVGVVAGAEEGLIAFKVTVLDIFCCEFPAGGIAERVTV